MIFNCCEAVVVNEDCRHLVVRCARRSSLFCGGRWDEVLFQLMWWELNVIIQEVGHQVLTYFRCRTEVTRAFSPSHL